MEKLKITEIKESYTVKSRIKGGGAGPDGSQFEYKTLTRYKEVITVEGWARFGHYLLDVVFYYIFALILAIPIVVVCMALGMDVGNIGEGSGLYNLVDRLISWLILYPGYYILFESSMQSTPGKLILGRVVVNEYGEKPGFFTIVKRSYSRIVPFESFSCFSALGWHDSWTDTMVIRKKDLEELKMALKVQDFDAEIPV